MPKKSSISIFIAATSALAISTVNTNSVKSGENDLGGLKEWNTDMALDADFILDENAQKKFDFNFYCSYKCASHLNSKHRLG